MQRVTGIGGIFFKARDPTALGEWYQRHLGVILEAWGGSIFKWATEANPSGQGVTIWNAFATDTDYFEPSQSSFMVNYRVDDLDAMLAQLRAAGCAVQDKVDSSEQGRFGWVMDPEGNKIELWQPPPGM